MWEMTIKKLRGSVHMVQALKALHSGIYVRGTQKRYLQKNPNEVYQTLWFILMPHYKISKVWQAIIQLILVYTAIYVPIKITFFADDSIKTPVMDIIDIIVDILFIMDLFVNFIMAYEKIDGTPETRPKMIARQYIKSWFIVDFIACFPM